MTTFQTIICLVFLAILVGVYMFYQAYKAKSTTIPFTADNIRKTLTELGALDIDRTIQGDFIFRTKTGRPYWLDTKDAPVLRLIASGQSESPINLEKAKSIADKFNSAAIGLYLAHDDESQSILFYSTSIVASCNTLKEVLPYMVSCIEQALAQFIQEYHRIPRN